MAKKIFEMKGATDEEVNAIRSLLRENKIDYYETPKGNFGDSMAAIWIVNDQLYTEARKIIQKYQNDIASHANKDSTGNTIPLVFIVLVILMVIWGMFLSIGVL